MPYRIGFAFPQLSQILPQDFVSALIIFIIIKIAVCSSSEGISKTCVVVCAWSVLLPSFLFSLSFLSSSFSRWVQFILLIFLAPDCGGGRSIPSCMLRGPEIKPEKRVFSRTQWRINGVHFRSHARVLWFGRRDFAPLLEDNCNFFFRKRNNPLGCPVSKFLPPNFFPVCVCNDRLSPSDGQPIYFGAGRRTDGPSLQTH